MGQGVKPIAVPSLELSLYEYVFNDSKPNQTLENESRARVLVFVLLNVLLQMRLIHLFPAYSPIVTFIYFGSGPLGPHDASCECLAW